MSQEKHSIPWFAAHPDTIRPAADQVVKALTRYQEDVRAARSRYRRTLIVAGFDYDLEREFLGWLDGIDTRKVG